MTLSDLEWLSHGSSVFHVDASPKQTVLTPLVPSVWEGVH